MTADRASSLRVLLSIFFLSLLKDWCGGVEGIQCFSCDAAHFNMECNGTANIRQCPITYDTCQTLVRFSYEVGKLQISKRCSKKESCTTQRQALQHHAPCNTNDTTHTPEWICADCCDTDLCNISGGSRLGRFGSAAGRWCHALLVTQLTAFTVSLLNRQIFVPL
ncbi:hypothetical protein BV898_08384 [Hypsibius exemplaris]|uniref:UPAR/Ly6 domain-containing protein n=1 Tax=Hypsibius exemplaris TaxID=2072580 RepID=A0A1W0WQJ0_HYPEX|nr:hypothetical protein BV898_08384 [Hypsibius exemplaris]